MVFDFNPILCFVCRLCRHSFASAEKLKEHKLACHLEECIGIKCIVFEERLLTADWVEDFNLNKNQHNRKINAKPINTSSFKECIKSQLDASTKESPFKNPYVSLTRITEQEINSSGSPNSSSHECQRKRTCRRKTFVQRLHPADKESELSQHEPEKSNGMDNNSVSIATDNSFISHQSSAFTNDIQLQGDIQVKMDSAYVDEPIPTSSVDEDASNILQHINFSSLSSGDPPIQSVSALNPPSEQEQQILVFITEAHGLNPNIPNIVLLGPNPVLVENQPLQIAMIQEPKPEPQVHLRESNQEQEQQQSAALRNHQSRPATSKSVGTSFMCETCFAFFSTKNNLKHHMATHSSIKPFECSKCPLKFRRNQELTRHQVVHGVETNFKCRFCYKYFGANKSLVEHERIHTGDKPFKCSIANCNYAAFRNSSLTEHTRAVHSVALGLQQFVCHKCGKTYGVKKSLETHIRNRHGDIV